MELDPGAEDDGLVSDISISGLDAEDLEELYPKCAVSNPNEPSCSVAASSKEASRSDGYDSDDESLSEKSSASVQVKKKQRRKRGGFKSGFLRRPKSVRVAKGVVAESDAAEGDAESVEGEASDKQVEDEIDDVEDYEAAINPVLDYNLCIDEDSKSILDESLPGTTEHEWEADEDEAAGVDSNASQLGSEPSRTSEDGLQQKIVPPSRKKRQKKTITMRRKFSWMKSSSAASTASTEDEHSFEPTRTSEPKGNEGSEDDICLSNQNQRLISEPAHSSPKLANLPSNESLCKVAEYLQLTLEDCYTVSISNDLISIYKVVNLMNPVIERAMVWHQNEVKFIVLNKEISQSHILYTLKKKPDLENIGEVSDYLTFLSSKFSQYRICEAISSHADAWEIYSSRGSGLIDNHLPNNPVLRSVSCSYLLLSSSRCGSCSSLSRTLREFMRRKLKRDGPMNNAALMRANNKYLSKEDLMRKNMLNQKEKKLSQQEVRRLTSRIKTLLEQKSQKIDSALSDDFMSILDENIDQNNDDDIQSIFWKQQREALKKRKTGKAKSMRWHPAMIRLALSLRMLSPSAYDFMKGFICLPSQRRLYDYSQFTDIQEGTQQDIMEILHDLIGKKCVEDHDKYFSLLLDEMSIRSDLVYSTRTGVIVGYTQITSMEESLRQLEAEVQDKAYEKRLAKKVLVFMLHGIMVQLRFVPAVFSTDDLSAAQLYSRMWDVIYACEEAGAKILLIIFDGASTNRKLIKMHLSMDDKEFVYSTLNLAAGEERILYFVLDPPHLIKTYRNCFANSYCHRKSRKLWKNDQIISWEAIVALYDITKADKFKTTKLTKAHVQLTSFSCMKVSLAAQVFSKSVASALEANKEKSPLKEVFSEELVRFIRLMNRFFDCLNVGEDSKKRFENPDLEVYNDINDCRFQFLEEEFLGYIEEWEESINTRFGRFSKEERSKMTISYQSLEAIKITIHSFKNVIKFLLEKGAKDISARQFNQDPLEQYFSILRKVRGDDDNPNLKQVLHTRLSLQAQGPCIASLGAHRGNTEVLKRTVDSLADAAPLPVRKKKKSLEL